MINMQTETLLTFEQAAERLPRKSRGRKISLSTLWRWATHGVRGQKLEVLYAGRTPMTSVEALQRFAERLSDRHQNDDKPNVDQVNDAEAAARNRQAGWAQ